MNYTSFNPIHNKPIYEELYDFIIEEIKLKHLKADEKLPSKKNMIQNLAVSQTTVETALDLLVAEGYLRSVNRVGYFVNAIDELIQSTTTNPLLPDKVLEDKVKYNFKSANVDTSYFPYHSFIKLQKECMLSDENLLLRGEGQGDNVLRVSIADYLRNNRGIECTPEQIVVGAGVEYLLSILILLLDIHSIAIESPSYLKIQTILHNHKIEIYPIPVESDGIAVERLEHIECNAYYVTPSHQFPTGITMTIAKRIQLINMALTKDTYIIEDDYDSEFQYNSKPITALSALQSDRVIYLNTFSRTLAPSLRYSYMVLPLSLLPRYNQLFSTYSSTLSRFEQQALARFISEKYYERHINRMRKIYMAKRDAALVAIQQYFSSYRVIGERSGLHFVVELHQKTDYQKLDSLMNEYDTLFQTYRTYSTDIEDDKLHIIIGFALIKLEDINEGIRRISEIVEQSKI